MFRKPIVIGLLGCLLAFAAIPAGAAQTDYAVGSVGGNELGLALGARPAGMGEAFMSLSNDVNTTAWNPAGLALIKGTHLGFMHNIYIQETSLEYLAYAQSIAPSAGLGAYLAYLNYGKLDKTDDSGQVTGQFSPFAFILGLGYGQRLMENMTAGVTLKLLQENIDGGGYTAAALDLGALYRTGLEGLQLGLSVKNLGTRLAGFSLPLAVKAGAAYMVPVTGPGDDWRVLLEASVPTNDSRYTAIHLGTEYWFQRVVAARLGYKVKDAGDQGGASGIAAGLGAKIAILNLDYALVSYGSLGFTHQIALSAHFGGRPVRRKRPSASASNEAAPAPALESAPMPDPAPDAKPPARMKKRRN